MVRLSVQSYTCSETDGEQTLFLSAQTPSAVAPDIAAHGAPLARLAHRALPALRQAGLQVRPRRGSRSQVLPLGELPGPATADRLRAPRRLRASEPVPVELPAASQRPRRDLRDQSRAAAPPRGALRHAGGRIESSTRPRNRYRGCRCGADQHGPELARCPPQPRSLGDGGKR